ncbi:MAG TPA: hypothetical protein VHB30_14470, partial [Solirubrobacteraceae bacterium]|nr:hypothetical protein [Solirubrobacteraceae bacterium]
ELGPGVGFRYVRSLGAFWIARGPRALVLMRDGRRLVRRSALPGSGVLLWNRYAGSAAGTPIAYRLETRRPFAEALAIARSVGGAQ